MKRVVVDTNAADELEAAARWYDLHHSGLGLEFLSEIDAAIERVRERPRAFGHVPGVRRELDVRRARVRRFPFTLVFIEMADEISVVAVAHDRRKPGYWKGRNRPP
jgi:hypothetical protein